MRDRVVIGSRGSALALWQSRAVAALLEKAHPGLSCHIEIIKTTGDRLHDASLVAISGKGVFTKEIEDAMLDGRVDFAVHSLKDLPTTLPPGLALGAVTEREDPRDALAARAGVDSLSGIPRGGRVGTSSPRRRCQLAALRPDIELVELRGNVDTRLAKIETEGLDGVILACAGLRRLGFEHRITESIPVDSMVPAVGQGALGIEIRDGDDDVSEIVQVLADATTAACCAAERAFLAAMGGGCAQPIAGHAWVDGELLRMIAAVDDGAQVRRIAMSSVVGQPEALGRDLAAKFQG
ncbi:MAG TPA: hydroxymethylbilane synthase [Blastocatellia bacterium]|nr:hydroxymethylbilane synthase [Blastocatellia bacterium]